MANSAITKAKPYLKIIAASQVGILLLNTLAKRFDLAARLRQTVQNGL